VPFAEQAMATVSWNAPTGRAERQLGAVTRIGRSPQNEVFIPDTAMSGCHARIVREGDAWALEDNGSTNGTVVNEQRVSRCVLRDGDAILVGRTKLTFHTDQAEAQAAPGPAAQGTAAPAAAYTTLWRKRQEGAAAPASASRPGDGSPSPAMGALALDQLFRGDVAYDRVSSVNSVAFVASATATAEGDPVQLARRLKAVYEISRATAATLDTSEILDRVLGAIFEIFEAADRAFILLVDPRTHEVHTAAARNRGGGTGAERGISRTALERAMRDREAVLCRDAATDARFADAVSIAGLGIRSLLIAPLVFRDEVLGAVHIDSLHGGRTFSRADVELLCVAASEVAGCLANARLHDQVVASERLAAVGQTLAGLTHCIKNILQGIKGGEFILEKGLEKGNLERVRTGWEMVRRNNAFMEELVYDLLTYSKQRAPECAPTDLNALCEETCRLVAERAKSQGVPLTFTADPSLGLVEVDPKGIRRCLLNFVTNAIDACAGRGGAVSVEARGLAEDGFVRIVVRDTGCGMSRETLAKLFSVFFSTKGSKGTGLGLPVSQKIVEEHGGRIDVESQEGKGTTFTLCLPPHRPQTTEL
jgi:signal transduction histidine kinase